MNVYQIEKNKTNQNLLSDPLKSLLTLNQSAISELSNKELIQFFCYDLKKILKSNDLNTLIQKLDQLDYLLIQLKEDEVIGDTPNLDEFYRNLSPIILRSIKESLESTSLYENIELKRSSEKFLLKGWLEAIRISIEEEIHIWQEKIL